MRVDHLSNLFAPTVAVVDFEGEDIGFVEVEGDLAEWVVGLNGHRVRQLSSR